MATINELLTRVREKPAELLAMQKQGKKIVGYTPGGYFPEELAYACGVIPVPLLRGGDHESVIASGPYLARFLDTFCRSQISYRILGDEPLYQMVDLVVAMVTDNHIRAIAESWEYWTDVDLLKLAVPANKTKHGIEYFLDGLYRLKDKLESISGMKMSEEKLKEEILLSNRMRELLGKISLLRKRPGSPISGRDFMRLNAASYFVDRPVMIESLETILAELEEKTDIPSSGPRIMLTGSTLALGDSKLIELLEESGATIVFEDITEGMRNYANTVGSEGDLMENLARRYFTKRLPPAYAKPAIEERFAYFFDRAQEFGVDGIVWYSLLYRDIYDMEGFLFERVARDKGIPVLKVNSDYDYGEKEPLRTRVETFIEMVKRGTEQ